jgi:hypothetical protein
MKGAEIAILVQFADENLKLLMYFKIMYPTKPILRITHCFSIYDIMDVVFAN